MIAYDTRDWFRALALHRSDTFRKLVPMLLVVGVWTLLVGWLKEQYLRIATEHVVSNLPIMHSLLGFAISMVLVFRTNTAYDRWWEGRKLWGQLVNTSRNLAIKVHGMFPDDAATRAFFAREIPLYAAELHRHLHQERMVPALEVAPDAAAPLLHRDRHVPNQVALHMTARLCGALSQGSISGEQFLALDRELVQFTEICGACERIKNTPIPFSYSAFIKKFIFIYVLTLPFGFVFSLGYIAIPVVMFIFYVLASLELIAEEIEEPFGADLNDLPTRELAGKIEHSVTELLGRS